jgi:subtilase family serine protease
MKRLVLHGSLIVTLALMGTVSTAKAQQTGRHAERQIRDAINESKLIELSGNTRPEAKAANDRGAVSADFELNHLLLQLKRSAATEAALQQYVDELADPKSPNFHKWLTPDQFAEQYGVAAGDVDTVTAWLQAHGFTVNGVQSSGLIIDFSGTAGQVRKAFHTDVHHLDVNGAAHFANMSDPKIPAALEPAIAGVVSIHDFRPTPQMIHKKSGPQYTYTNTNGTFHELAAGDLATIYNLTPLFQAGYSGRGQSIMVVEDTYLYSATDWTIFRKIFGLYKAYPYGTLTQVSPTGSVTCTNPGVPATGDDGEAAIDVEWASAAAPNAAIILAACSNTSAFGGLIALENTLNGPAANLPSVVSISYGEAEAANGATANLAYKNAYIQAVAEGVSIFVSSGDELAASDDNGNVSTHGIGISGFASTAYNVAVGGTDFGYTADGVDPSTYWSATNTPFYSSALSYIQEIPWNGSCASALLAGYYGVLAGQGATTPLAFCNSTAVTSTSSNDNYFQNAFGGSGGPSGCATGTRATSGVVGGTCAGYPKPAFQAGIFGNPNDGVRDIPDVALFASNGIFDAYYAVCWSNPNGNAPVYGGYTCTGAPSTWAGFGGTSVSSPIMAGIQALVNQKTGSRWGNPNTTYYAMANAEYGAGGSGAAPCNSTSVNKTSNNCVFYDITEGDIVGACKGSGAGSSTLRNCYRPAGDTYGILSLSNTASQGAYYTTSGWDFPTGIGSVNAYNLVMNWPTTP